MGADNVDIFKRIVFRIPEAGDLAVGITVLGLIYSLVFSVFLDLFTSHLIEFTLGPVIVLSLSLMLFIAPSLLSGELLHIFLPKYPRKWGYFLAMSNQFIFLIYTVILTGADNFANAWSILWLGVISVFLSNLFVLLTTMGQKHLYRISVLSLVHPVAILAGFHFLLGKSLQIPLRVYVANLALLPLAGMLLLIIILTTDYILKSNVSNVSAPSLTSALLQKKQEPLNLGYPTQVEVQSLEIGDNTRIAIPWIHPGPLEGFGGGQVTTDIIEELNRNGKGFFLHFPSTHKSDLANPSDSETLIDALARPEKQGKASRLLKRDYDGLRFYGRKLENGQIVFMETRDFGDYDDFEMSIFREVIDPRETVLVDLHNAHEEGSRREVWYNTDTAEFMREKLAEFLEELGQQKLQDYRAGSSSRIDDTPVFALVEEVDGQKTLLFGIEGNNVSEKLLELEEHFSEDFDEVMLFTTDTHRSIHELSSDQQADPEHIIETIETASSNVKSSSIGFESRLSDPVKLLQEDYHSLIFSINILVRLIPLSLAIFYLALIIWIFF